MFTKKVINTDMIVLKHKRHYYALHFLKYIQYIKTISKVNFSNLDDEMLSPKSANSFTANNL